MSSGYHETGLSGEVRDIHRALASLQEELEAVDWYHQRVDAAGEEALKAVLAHNRDDELEHAAMTLEWLRRRLPELDRQLRRFLFTTGEITGLAEAGAPAAGRGSGNLGLGDGSKERT